MTNRHDNLHLPSIRPPIEAWLRESEDMELRAELEELATRSGHLGVLVAAGALSRYERVIHTSAQREAFFLNLTNGTLPEEDRQRRWSRELPPAERDELVSYAFVLCAWLEDELARSANSPLHGEILWPGICQLRDDIESLQTLLSVHREARVLEAKLERLDTIAMRITRGRRVLLAQTVRLARAAIQYPEAWWTGACEGGDFHHTEVLSAKE